MGSYTAPGYGYQQPYFQPQPYNPILNNDQRMQQILQANPHLAQQYAQPQQPQQQPMPQALKGRPVSGIEEARAAQIDFDGSLHVFTDVASGRIYTKQLGLNGAAVFNTYALQEPEPPQAAVAAPGQAITQDDVAKAVQAATGALNDRVAALESQINTMGGAGNEPYATGRPAARQRKSDGAAAADGGQ